MTRSKEHALVVLQTIELAVEAGAVTALLDRVSVRCRMQLFVAAPAIVFARASTSLHFGNVGGPSLSSVDGRCSSQVQVTGDDAIALGYNARPRASSSLGVNFVPPFIGGGR